MVDTESVRGFLLSLRLKRKSLIKATICAVLGVAMIASVILFAVPGSPARNAFLVMMDWLEDDVPLVWGSIILACVYALGLIFILPGTPFNLAAGFLFGVWAGSVVAVVGCDLGALLGFFAGKTLLRQWASERMQKSITFRAIDNAMHKNAFLIISLVRLSPVLPFGLCNYLFGATKVNFFVYWAASTVGLLPATIAYTYLGTLMRNLTDIYSTEEVSDDKRAQQFVFIGVAAVTTLVVIIVVTVITRRALNHAIEEEQKLSPAILEHDKIPLVPSKIV